MLKLLRITDVRPILRESINFQRGLSDREIKGLLVGWKPGQFLINPHTNIVYLYLGEPENPEYVNVFSIGHLQNKNITAGKEYFKVYTKTFAEWNTTNFKSKDRLKLLSNEEWEIIKPVLTKEYINKLESSFGIKVIMP
jgi:hypothetical protein